MTAFGDSLKEIYPDLKRTALKLAFHNKADADDLVQKALVRALEKQHLFKGGNLAGWVVTLMKNLNIDDARKRKDQVFVDIDKVAPAGIKDDSIHELSDTQLALNRLGEKCQKILILIAEGYKYAEIAQTLETPIGTVMSRLLRCRKQLSKELELETVL